MLGISNDEIRQTRKRKKRGVTFNEDEEVINPEDVDPNVGRFRNLIQSTVVPTKVCNLTFKPKFLNFNKQLKEIPEYFYDKLLKYLKRKSILTF